MTLGVVSRVLLPELSAADHAIPTVILTVVPPVLAELILTAPMAAIMSTLSSFLLVSSSAIVWDLYQRNTERRLNDIEARRMTQIVTLLIASVGMGFALRPPDFLQYIVIFSGTGLSATFLFPTLLGIYWPRMNKAGCIAGVLGGFVSFLAQYAAFGTRSFGGLDPFVWSLLISLSCTVIGTMSAAPPPKRIVETFFGDNTNAA